MTGVLSHILAESIHERVTLRLSPQEILTIQLPQVLQRPLFMELREGAMNVPYDPSPIEIDVAAWFKARSIQVEWVKNFYTSEDYGNTDHCGICGGEQ